MSRWAEQLSGILPTALRGTIARTTGMTAAAAGLPAPVGALVEIERPASAPVRAEVIGFRDDLTLLYPLGDLIGVRRGDAVRLLRTSAWLRVGADLKGRVLNGEGRCVDGGPQPALTERAPIYRAPPPAVERPRINTPLGTGIRAFDSLLTCGSGQRMGIFAGPGVGKSVTLGMMARYTSADVTVIALVGERGRELNEFIARDLGPEGLARSVVVVATSDEPAPLRLRAAFAATAIAEHFRDQGQNVLLLMDSLTRFAHAQREIGLAAGEPPTTRGYPPSVFSLLPKLVERAGRSARGSITGFYSVLMEADDPTEPISDAVRGLLDGHTLLSRKLAGRGHWPAIDVLESLSRLMPEIVDREHREAAQSVRALLAAYRDHEDLITIGAYRRGSHPQVDLAIDMQAEIHHFLQQRTDEPAPLDEARRGLLALAQRAAQPKAGAPAAKGGSPS